MTTGDSAADAIAHPGTAGLELARRPGHGISSPAVSPAREIRTALLDSQAMSCLLHPTTLPSGEPAALVDQPRDIADTGQQVGGSVGLAVLGTVAWTVVAHSIQAQAAVAARAGHPPRPGSPLAAAIYHHALATGFGRGFLVAAGIALLTLIINFAVIRVRRADLAGAQQPVRAVPAEPAQPR